MFGISSRFEEFNFQVVTLATDCMCLWLCRPYQAQLCCNYFNI